MLPIPVVNEPCPYCVNETPDVTTFCDVCGRMLCYTFTYATVPSHIVYVGWGKDFNWGYPCETLFDAGASVCPFHGKIADALHMDLTNAPTSYFHGIASTPILAYEVQTRIAIRMRSFQCRVYFSYQLNDNALGMIGQEFFQFCTFTLDEYNHRVFLRENELHISRYKFCRACGVERTQLFSAFCRECGSPLQGGLAEGRELPLDILNAWN